MNSCYCSISEDNATSILACVYEKSLIAIKFNTVARRIAAPAQYSKRKSKFGFVCVEALPLEHLFTVE
jgi:hypothetical protein